LGELSDLPASPCLSSRVETGIAIDPVALRLIDETEQHLRKSLNPSTVRCRIRSRGVVVELDEATIGSLGPERRAAIKAAVVRIFRAGGIEHEVSIAPYQVGSAFLHKISIQPRV
jgi:uncharacterized protein